MNNLLEAEAFSSVRAEILMAAEQISSSSVPIILISPPTIEGSLAIAPLEAALIDSKLPYKRRFTSQRTEYFPNIQVAGNLSDSESVFSSVPLSISLGTIVVVGLTGYLGTPKRGPLTAVAQAHALAQAICPSSNRLRRLRPWALSGNWLNKALDTTFDPVFTSIRDFLLSEGSIRVVPITEVRNPNLENYFWLQKHEIERSRKDWRNSTLESKEILLSSLAKPALNLSKPSTARLEELIWHCVLGPDWDTDLASQISQASMRWKKNEKKSVANSVTDSLVASGRIKSFQP